MYNKVVWLFLAMLEARMKNRAFRTITSVNSVVQAIYCLASPMALGALIAWFLTKHGLVGRWIYAVMITAGALVGLMSMIGFLLKYAATENAIKEAEEKESYNLEDSPLAHEAGKGDDCR